MENTLKEVNSTLVKDTDQFRKPIFLDIGFHDS